MKIFIIFDENFRNKRGSMHYFKPSYFKVKMVILKAKINENNQFFA